MTTHERSHHIGRTDTNPERKRDVKQTQSSSSIRLGWIYRDARQTVPSLFLGGDGTHTHLTSPHLTSPPHHQHHVFLSPSPLLLHLRRTLAPLMDDHKPNHSADVKPPFLDRHNRHSGGGREDCWSEGATGTLIDAWGDRYLQLSRGNLRQKDWKDVADAVNARQDALDKPRKTDVQCKNRIDTIKKKYKLERSKPGPSKWPFYAHLEELIGPSGAALANTNLTLNPNPNPKPSHSPSPAVTFTVKKLNPIPNPNSTPNGVIGLYSGGSSSKSRLNSAGSTGSSHDSGDCDPDRNRGVGGGKRKNAAVKEAPEGIAFRELAKAILKFGEVYERIESSKQQQIMELERQRMEFTKDLEFQRMKMFMEAQLQLEKTKRPKYASGAGKKL